MKTFPVKQRLTEFVASTPTLPKIPKEVIQAEKVLPPDSYLIPQLKIQSTGKSKYIVVKDS